MTGKPTIGEGKDLRQQASDVRRKSEEFKGKGTSISDGV